MNGSSRKTRGWLGYGVAWKLALAGGLLLMAPLLGPGCSDDVDRTPAAGGSGTGNSGTGNSGNTGNSGTGNTGTGNYGVGGSTTGGETNPTCEPGTSAGDVQAPQFLYNLQGQTSWFASPVVHDLDGDGNRELIAAYYSVFVFDHQGSLITELDGGDGRVYAPHVVADLEGDGTLEIVYGKGHEVYAYEWTGNGATLKAGWPADASSGVGDPEVRGMAAADLNNDAAIEIVVTTTQTADEEDGGSQVYVFNPDGTLYQPAGISWEAWPRYNAATGTGNDADRNVQGHHGFGCYGLNVGIGDVDDDDDREIIATYDNHHIQVFDHDGVAHDSSDWFTNRSNEYSGERMTWGQFIRWTDPQVEEDHYHNHTGEWPHPSWTEWLQWTHSPPSVADLNLDGRNEVIGVPNIEMHEPYETQAYGIMVLEGSYGDGSRSAMRLAGWETLPRGGAPITDDDWYPPSGVPATAIVDLQGDEHPEIIVSLNDGAMYAYDAGGSEIWHFNFMFGHSQMYASEAIIADLNQDGSAEVLFTTFGDPDTSDSGHLVILAANGALLHDTPLPNPGHNGNGNGAPAAPAVGDLDGDGQLEVFVQTFDHDMDVFTIPGSAENCLLWPTARGGPLRMGQPNGIY